MIVQQGAIETLYYYMWLSSDSIKDNSIKFKLPDTIIYRLGVIQTWYFTNCRNEIQVKKIENRTVQNVEKAFMAGQEHDIIAMFIECKHQKQFYHTSQSRAEFMTDQLNIDCKASILYLNTQDFISFINNSEISRNGILQKFVQPDQYESVIQAIWSQKVMILSQRVNLREIGLSRMDVQERCASFNSSEVYSRSQPVKSQRASHAIRQLMEYIYNRVKIVSYDQHVITRAVIYCKFDKYNNLNFLYSTSLRTNADCPFPIQFGMNCRPDIVKIAVSTNCLKPAQLTQRLVCMNCMKQCQQQDLQRVKYHTIIDRNVKNRMEIKPYSVSVQPPYPVQPDASFDYVANTTKLIPDLFKKLYPNMCYTDYAEFIQNEGFRAQSLLMCTTCYLKIMKPPMKAVIKQTVPRSKSILNLINSLKDDSNKITIKKVPTTTCLTSRQDSSSPLKSRSTRIQSGYLSADNKKRVCSTSRQSQITTPFRRLSVESYTINQV